ncbi:hypothetical protein BDW60DRAFT_90696 [Aspergillus nidulans var. acristatus]
MSHRLKSLVAIFTLVSLPYALSLPSSSPCTELASLLPGKVFFPNSSTYNSSGSSYFARQEQEIHPACIITPSSAEDVATAVQHLADLPNSTFAIRSGGHSSNPGAANAPDGVTFDLTQLNTITIHPDTATVSVGSGLSWQEVYDVLDPYGLVVLGGRTGIVGVGGLLTGGGLSTFSPELGFACDSIVSMQVVLASGEIVVANETHNAPLFFALKGGQNNFGVVTRFDLATFPQDDFWGGAIQYPASANEAQLDAFWKFKNLTVDPYAEVEQSFLYNASAPSANPEERYYSSNNLFYTRPVASVDDTVLRVFTSSNINEPQGYNSMRVSNLSDFARELSLFQPVGQYSIYATTTFRLSPTILQQVHALWRSFTSTQPQSSVPGLLSVLTFQTLPPVIPSSHNSLGFPPNSHPEEDLILVLISNYWSGGADSSALRDGTRALIEEIDALAKSEGLDERFRYMNYAAEWQDVVAGYGEESVRELWRVSRRYDPRGIFQERVPGGFKLPR